MIPELIISGEEANGEFLMLVPGKMLFCSFCVMLMKQVRKIVSIGDPFFFRVIVPFKIKVMLPTY
ncbi:hypothetical protein [Shigella flexneri]|uniref:hypothetical protein n=1 Tax=Shigella flexneri TaxID=623 RepID=UPI0010709D52|nr:hypothetical protein [Shigella flexneri]